MEQQNVKAETEKRKKEELLDLLNKEQSENGIKELKKVNTEKYSLSPSDVFYNLAAHRNIKTKLINDYLLTHKDVDTRVLGTADLIIEAASKQEKEIIENELSILLKQEKPEEDIQKYFVNYLYSKYNSDDLTEFAKRLENIIRLESKRNEAAIETLISETNISIDVLILPSKTKQYNIYIDNSALKKKFKSVDDIILNIRSFLPKNEAIMQDVLKELKEKYNQSSNINQSERKEWASDVMGLIMVWATVLGGSVISGILSVLGVGDALSLTSGALLGIVAPWTYYGLKLNQFSRKSKNHKKNYYFLEAYKDELNQAIDKNSR